MVLSPPPTSKYRDFDDDIFPMSVRSRAFYNTEDFTVRIEKRFAENERFF